MATMVQDFREVAKRGVERCIIRNKRTLDNHSFVMQGLEQVYFVHVAMFNMANHRKQRIIAADLPEDVHACYKEEPKNNPGQVYTIGNVEKEKLEDMLEGLLKPETASKYKFRLDKGIPIILDKSIPDSTSPALKKGFALSNVRGYLLRWMSTARTRCRSTSMAARPRHTWTTSSRSRPTLKSALIWSTRI
jgi:hypothetical protein